MVDLHCGKLKKLKPKWASEDKNQNTLEHGTRKEDYPRGATRIVANP